MKFTEVNSCLRCGSKEFLISFPVKVCENCKCIMSADNLHNPTSSELAFDLKYIKFQIGDDCLELNFAENKTYLNGKKLIDSLLPTNISEEKLKTYIVFS